MMRRIRDRIDKMLQADCALSSLVAMEAALDDDRFEVRGLPVQAPVTPDSGTRTAAFKGAASPDMEGHAAGSTQRLGGGIMGGAGALC